jgi:FG-GAP-like repeat
MRRNLVSFFMLALTGLFAPPSSWATAPVFETPHSFTIPSSAIAFGVGDFNRDGNLDLVVVDPSIARAQVYLGNGKGSFTKGVGAPIAANPYCITVADFNNDGILDLAIAGNDTTEILLGNGDGTFQAGKQVPESRIFSIAAGDFNNDGNQDLLLNGETILLGKGDGTFQQPTTFGTYATYVQVAIGDFNGDHKLDFALLYNGATNLVVTYLGNGDGTFQTPLTTELPGYYPRTITAGDFNGDGKTDLATSGCSDSYCNAAGTANILLSNGNGTFQVQTIAELIGFKPGAILAGDINRDGKTDLVAMNGSDDMAVWTGKGDGTFNVSQSWALPPSPGNAAIGDFNNDGQPDIAVINSENDNTQTVMTVVLGTARGKFLAAAESYAYAPDVLATGDFNEDGKLDAIVSSGFDNKGTVALGNGNGTFRALASFPMLPENNSANEILVDDFNNDHHLDIISMSDNNLGQVVIGLGNGNGTFKPGVRINCGVNATFVVAGDFNGDGKLDLATTNYGAGAGNVDICLGNGDGTFQAPTTIGLSSGLQPNFAAATDLNGDGKVDLIVIDSGNPGSYITMLGNGDGTFQSPSSPSALGTYPMQPILGDLNGDGKIDMVLQMNNSTDNLYVLLGNGDGSFQTPQIYSLIEGPSYVLGGPVIADFNGDGIPDIAAQYGCCQVGVVGINMLYGTGLGTFTMGPSIALVPGMIVGGDFNGDGKTDILFGDPYSNMVSALLDVSR